jgi:phosphatidylserine decarboxylase
MSTLPLKAISRLWGKFNELQIPYYLRVPGFKLYSWIFGVKYELSNTFTYVLIYA